MVDNKFGIILYKSINFLAIFMLTIGYSIGAGLVSYIGKTVKPGSFWLGLLIIVLFNISAELLFNFFKYNAVYYLNPNTKSAMFRNGFLLLSLTMLTIGAMLSVLLYSRSFIGFILWIFLGLFFIILIIYALPPFNLKKNGYGEFLLTICVVALTPAFAFMLQINELHSTLFLITFPAFFLLLSFFLSQSLQNYYEDIKEHRHTMMTILGWRTGMNVHNYFLLITFLLYGLASVLGLPGRLAIPALVSFPIACIQFWEMWRIGEGYKPRWKVLRISSMGSISILSYFLLFILWLR